MHRRECCKNCQMWVLFREAVSDQVICCAPVINSQIQSGMSGELTCSSFHTNRSAQWAENQYRVRLKIVHPNTDCPLNNNTTTAAGQNAGFRQQEREREEKKAKSIKWTSYSLRSSALGLHCTHLSPALPGRTGTWQHQEEILTDLKAKRNQRGWEMWTSRPRVGQTHQPYLLHAHVGNRHRGHVLRFDSHFTAVLDLNLNPAT